MFVRYMVRLLIVPSRMPSLVRHASGARKHNNWQSFENIPAELGNSNTNPAIHRQLVEEGGRAGRALNVAILGIPNSGKSTLINQLVGKEVCPHSSKQNTTRKNARAILTEEETQVVFLDTPGVVNLQEKKRFQLEQSLMVDPEASCKEADLILVLQDVSNRYVREAIDKKILRLLCKYQHRAPAILVLNKLDTIPSQRRVYDLIRKLTCNRLEGESGEVKISEHDPKWNVESYIRRKKRAAKSLTGGAGVDEEMNIGDVLKEARQGGMGDKRAEELSQGMIGWPGFRDVFSISAKYGNGVKDLKRYLIDTAKPGYHRFPATLLLDIDPRDTVVNIVKSKLLEHLDHDVPYALQPKLEHWEFDDNANVLRISVSVATKNHRESGSLIGHHGNTVRVIADEVEQALEDFFDCPVKFYLQPLLPEAVQKAKPPNLNTKPFILM